MSSVRIRSFSRGVSLIPAFMLAACAASESTTPVGSGGTIDPGQDSGTGGTVEGGTPDASSCPDGEKLCAGECVSVDDPDYGCAATACFPCSVPGAFAICLGGSCAIDECETDRADCNDDEGDGCEVDTRTDALNCNGCGNECAGTAYGAPNCNQGSCAFLCDSGFAPCATGCCPVVPALPTRLVAARSHSCALTAAGGVKCWGKGGFIGSPSDSPTAIEVPGLSSGVVAISGKDSHTCALTQGGGVKCWGENPNGGLGNGSSGNASVAPVDVIGLGSGASAITAGSGFTCAKLTAGGYRCWGANGDGQLGTGAKGDTNVPVAANELSALNFVAAGGAHACGLVSGGVKCWGSNQRGQLGDGSTTDSLKPIDAYNLSMAGAFALDAVSSHTCVVVGDSSLLCWGSNEFGQLGTGSTADTQAYPQPVFDIAGPLAAIATGFRHTCGLLESGAVQCWGEGSSGQLGDGDSIDRYTATNVDGLTSEVIAIACGEYHSCAMTADGLVRCWGLNANGRLGDATTTDRAAPVLVQGL